MSADESTTVDGTRWIVYGPVEIVVASDGDRVQNVIIPVGMLQAIDRARR
jgi:hypothetical protein